VPACPSGRDIIERVKRWKVKKIKG
jgi:hypothetical protein